MAKLDIEKISRYIQENMDREITLKDIAEYINYSEFHLSRTFKKQTGYSIRQYIEAIKVAKGIEKLFDDKGSVTDIAYDVGHKSPGTFSNTFKKHTGIAPKRYLPESGQAYHFLMQWIKKREILMHYDNFFETNNSLQIEVRYPNNYEPKITCIGLFRTAIPKEEPIVGIATVERTKIRIENVPDGSFFLLACEILEDLTLSKNYVLDENFRVAIQEPIVFSGNSHYEYVLEMRRPIESDPPITMNLPVMLMRSFKKQSQFMIRKFFSKPL